MTKIDLKTRFSTRYGIPYPIVQAGMAFASMTEALPVAVSEAGGIGTIANLGLLPPDVIERVWQSAQEKTARPLSINLITYYVQPQIIQTIAKLCPLSVSFHWGRPAPEWVELLHDAGIEVWEQIGSVAEAVRAVHDGIDVIIVQGSEAGGHNYGDSSLLTLLPAVREAVGPEPMLLGSGGIVDGATMAAALMLGADGVWVGTRYLMSVESEAHPEWKKRLLSASASDTCRTHVFGRKDPLFNPMRVLQNKVVSDWHHRVPEIAPDGQAVIGSLTLFGQAFPLHRFQHMAPTVDASGDFEELPLLCGEGIGLINDIETAADITHRLAREALLVLNTRSLSEVADTPNSTALKVERAISTIHRHAALNAVIAVDAESAMAQAIKADQDDDELKKPAHGLTMLVKDNIAANGFPLTGGSPAFAHYRPAEESSAVTLLRDAGVIVLGKANLHEVAFGVTSANECTGFVRNPFDTARLAGGSSGGSAVAVATGMSQISLATDTGGSARIPAALCGVFGFRPSTGRYPQDGVMTLSPTRDTLGLLGADLNQLAVVDAVLSGEPSNALERPTHLKLGVVRKYFWEGLSDSMAEACEASLQKLKEDGIELIELDASDIGLLDTEINFPIAIWETADTWRRYVTDTLNMPFSEFLTTLASHDVRELFELMDGSQMPSHADYLTALAGVDKIRDAYAKVFESGVDAIIMPSTIREAVLEEERELSELNGVTVPTFPTFVRQTSPSSLAGVPSITVPAGYLDNGLPYGLQLEAPRMKDRELFHSALRVHRACGEHIASKALNLKVDH